MLPVGFVADWTMQMAHACPDWGLWSKLQLSHCAVYSIAVYAPQASARAKCPPGLDMSVSILTSGYWPSYPVLEAKLPEELTAHQVAIDSTADSISTTSTRTPRASPPAKCS